MDTYKEKYNEALERAKKLKENPQSVFNEYSPKEGDTICDYIFPELKESEDERIRKELIEFIKTRGGFKQEWIAWLENIPYTIDHEKREGFHLGYKAALEKQGGKKPAIEMVTPEESLGIDSETYNKIVDECIYGEQKPINKIEAKFKVGDYIERKDGLGCHAKVIYIGKNVYGCEKLIYTKDSSPFFELMFENQDEFRISPDFQQKPAWSEEDEVYLNTTIAYLNDANEFKKTAEKCITWLKSLKQRYTWKPSDAQMKALDSVIDEYDGYPEFDSLVSLKNDLRKL